MSLHKKKLEHKELTRPLKLIHQQFIRKSSNKATKSCIIITIMMDYKIQPLTVIKSRSPTQIHIHTHS